MLRCAFINSSHVLAFRKEKCPEKKRSDLPRFSKRDNPERVARTDTRARRTIPISRALPRLRHDLGHVDLRPFFREFAD